MTSEAQSILNGTAKTIAYTYDKAGRRTGMNLHDGATDVAFAYDSRDRCNDIDLEGVQLAAYKWHGSQLYQRDTTCDYPGSTKPKFEAKMTLDGLARVTYINVNHVTPDMNRNWETARLGEWSLAYDTAGNRRRSSTPSAWASWSPTSGTSTTR